MLDVESWTFPEPLRAHALCNRRQMVLRRHRAIDPGRPRHFLRLQTKTKAAENVAAVYIRRGYRESAELTLQFRASEGPFQLGDHLLVAGMKYKLGTKHFLPQVQIELRCQKC